MSLSFTDEVEIKLSPRGRHLLRAALDATKKASEFKETGMDFESSRYALIATLYRVVDEAEDPCDFLEHYIEKTNDALTELRSNEAEFELYWSYIVVKSAGIAALISVAVIVIALM